METRTAQGHVSQSKSFPYEADEGKWQQMSGGHFSKSDAVETRISDSTDDEGLSRPLWVWNRVEKASARDSRHAEAYLRWHMED